jgi:hypothetical protein
VELDGGGAGWDFAPHFVWHAARCATGGQKQEEQDANKVAICFHST